MKYLELVDLDVVDLEVVDLEVVNLEVVNLEVVNLEVVNLEVVNLEVVNLEVVKLGGGQSGDHRSDGRCNSSSDSIHWLTHDCCIIENSVQQVPPRDERLAGRGR